MKQRFMDGVWFGAGLLVIVSLTGLIGQAINSFTAGQVVSAAAINANFTALNLDVGNLKADATDLKLTRPPVGSIIAWHKSLPGTPVLPAGWVECNGQLLTDSASIYNGQIVPNLNGDGGGANTPGLAAVYRVFLRGGTTSGSGQLDAFQGHYHRMEKDTAIFEWFAPGGVNRGVPSPGPDGQKFGQATTGYRAREAINGAHGAIRVDTETRPVNVSMVWIMRVK